MDKVPMVGGRFATWYGIAMAEIDAEICDYCYAAYIRSLPYLLSLNLALQSLVTRMMACAVFKHATFCHSGYVFRLATKQHRKIHDSVEEEKVGLSLKA